MLWIQGGELRVLGLVTMPPDALENVPPMRTIIRILVVAVALFAAVSTRAQNTTTVRFMMVDVQTDVMEERTNSVDLVEGEFAELVWYSKPSTLGVSVNHEGTNGVSLLSFALLNTPTEYSPKPLGGGPGKLQFRYFAGSTGTMRYARALVRITKIVAAAPAAPAGSIPSTAVVIPTDATGPVDVVLESSADLVTWTPALPGTYGSTEPKRFFRVRAVKQ